jgi:hypothetical protein
MSSHVLKLLEIRSPLDFQVLWRKDPELRLIARRTLYVLIAAALVVALGTFVQALLATGGGNVLANLPMALFGALLSLALVPVVAALLLTLLAVPTVVILPLVRKFARPAKAHFDAATDLDAHMHFPESDIECRGHEES